LTRRAPQLLVGASGWHYDHWIGPFYPKDIVKKRMLETYCGHFDTVELNNSFYKLPTAAAFEDWRARTPSGFVFAIKANRFITHMKKLKDPAATLPPFVERLQSLGGKLGPVLFQLPPRWGCDLERLAKFLNALPKKRRHVFEFRDPSWLNDEVATLLSAHNAALAIHRLDDWAAKRPPTADFVYVRLHGPGDGDERYTRSYAKPQLAAWARAISEWRASGRDIYAYFDNDHAAHAPNNARTLRNLLSH
jgi:uncharacterized protein YecE (DUF72 family)